MNPNAHQIKTDCEKQFNALYAGYEKTNGEILLSYFGGLDQSLTYILSNKVEQLLEDHEQSRSIIKRIFSILIESLQNIRLHAIKNVVSEELAGIMVVKFENHYEINVLNLADENARFILQNRINQVNEMTHDQLKRRYMETMTNGVISDKGGAGLGIITIALKSKNALKYNFKQLSSGLFVVSIRIKVESKG